jgi:hypothetical protein
MTDSLFPDLAPSAEEMVKAIDLKIEKLLYNAAQGNSGSILTKEERYVLRRIRYRRGSANAITIDEIQDQIDVCIKQLTARQVKQIVRTLRLDYHLPIGSSKSATGGYFLMISHADRAIYHAQVLDQVRAELEVFRAVDGHDAALELLGQLRLEVAAEVA